jgi:hypothetical protein
MDESHQLRGFTVGTASATLTTAMHSGALRLAAKDFAARCAYKLSIADRLQLFRAVCLAVQYAHQTLVIHRESPARWIQTFELLHRDYNLRAMCNRV